jgi:hypothetical protein
MVGNGEHFFASFYGTFNDEFFVHLCGTAFWIANRIAAILFGTGHLSVLKRFAKSRCAHHAGADNAAQCP